jgi:hypothetical protein
MSFSKISGALITAFEGGDFGLPTAHENIDYDPTPGTAWAEVFIIPNQPTVGTLGAAGEDNHTGLMQIDLNYPPDSGSKAAIDKADEIRALFKAGSRFSYSGQLITVLSCGRSRGVKAGGWFRVSMTINWYAFTAR